MSEMPSRLPRLRWGVLLAGLGLAGVALLFDQAVVDWLSRESVRGRIAKPLDVVMGAGGLIAVLAILNCYPNRVRLWVGFLVPMLLSAGIAHGLKWLIGRARPLAEEGPLAFDFFTRDTSFPSGHTAGAVTAAVVLGIYFPRARWVFYFFAACTAFKRILDRWHYPSDVFAGAVVGLLAVYVSVRLLGLRYYQKEAATPK